MTRVELPWGMLIDDSYNANPLSMKLWRDTLSESGAARKAAILGNMAELGGEVRRYHLEIGAYARAKADIVIAVGEAAKDYNGDIWFPSVAACAASIGALVHPGDCVLVKGSASARMAIVAKQLQEVSKLGAAA